MKVPSIIGDAVYEIQGHKVKGSNSIVKAYQGAEYGKKVTEICLPKNNGNCNLEIDSKSVSRN